MRDDSQNDTIAAWLETIAADSQDPGPRHTVLPPSDPKQPLLASFQRFLDTNSAAPLAVKGTLAEGGMGIVKVAEQSALGRTVVVKTLRSNFEAHAAEHVLREAWATGSLEHPNIVPVHDIRVDEHGSPMIVLKRIEGDTWTKLMHNPELLRERFGVTNTLDWNTDILRQVTQAVRFSHSRGILHRDLKPDNVMIGAFGEVYLVDWGIAMNLCGDKESRLPLASGSTAMAGTPCYMAPEMLGGAPLDERTDIYLLGSVLFEIIADRPPHRTHSLEALMEDIRQSEPQFPEGACPLLSAVCRRAMSQDPADRFSDASEFATALSQYRRHRDSSEMAAVAHEQFDELIRSLAAGDTSRHEIYHLFGAIRVGFLEALKIWPENLQARSELDQASVKVIEFELLKGNPTAAQTLYRDIESPPEALQERIADALRKKESEKAELQKLRSDRDFSVGMRTRIFLIILLGMIWTITPLLASGDTHWAMTSYRNMILTTAAFMGVCLGLWYWARDTMRSTMVNRQLSRAMVLVFPLQMALFAGAEVMNLPREMAAPLMIFVWLSAALNVVASIDHRFWPAPLGYLVAFLVAAQWHDLRYFAMAAGNFTFMWTAIYVWYPRAGEYPEGLVNTPNPKRKPAA